MDQNETLTLTVFEKPELKDQVISAAVGAVATIVATVAISAAATGLQALAAKAAEKKLAKKIQNDLPEQN